MLTSGPSRSPTHSQDRPAQRRLLSLARPACWPPPVCKAGRLRLRRCAARRRSLRRRRWRRTRPHLWSQVAGAVTLASTQASTSSSASQRSCTMTRSSPTPSLATATALSTTKASAVPDRRPARPARQAGTHAPRRTRLRPLWAASVARLRRRMEPSMETRPRAKATRRGPRRGRAATLCHQQARDRSCLSTARSPLRGAAQVCRRHPTEEGTASRR
mmetsp:Transcript_14751/g.38367  ORF Transcript_14751/g.38367 Transcript_14751/m.38367 type:complete len:217 (-) Transcript_14751:628-1278(-)